MPARLFRLPALCLLFVLSLFACQPQAITETVEVTRLVFEYVEVEGEELEVTRVVSSTELTAGEVVEVTRVLVEEVQLVVTATPEPEWSADEPAATPIANPSISNPQSPSITPVSEPGGDTFEDYGVNPFIDTLEDQLSTFAIDVDTGSYTIGRQYLLEGFLPPDESVRVEEYVNYFEQGYPLPAEDAFAIHLEAAPSPYSEGSNHHLLRVGIQGYDVSAEERPDATLILVLDTSDSMEANGRLDLVLMSVMMLQENLRPTDRIAIVTYGSEAQVVLPPTLASDRAAIDLALNLLQVGGSTNLEAGLLAAYQLADQYAEPGRIMRLVLCSDGVANVGSTTAETILQHGRAGVPLSTFGFGLGGYNDVLMEQLANQGNGRYAYIDSLDEAQRQFVDNLTGTVLTIARDARVQVEFNPSVVERYRLLGYENRAVADGSFRDDTVDAGEIGAGHSVTALYEVRLAEDAPAAQPAVTVHLRYADPESAEVQEIARSLAVRDFANLFEATSPRFQMDAVVAEFAELLRNSYWAQENSLPTLAQDAARIAALLPADPDVQEFAELVALAAELSQ
jgi:Ca-activated chloride channel family protein